MGNRLSIRNLGDIINTDTLEEMFSSVGDVLHTRIEIKCIRGNDYRVGYVEMETEQQAADGIDRFHGQKKHGAILVVTEDKPHIPLVKASKSKVAKSKEKRTQ